MRLTPTSSCALRAVSLIARHKDRSLPSWEIAERQRVSERFLLRVLRPLVRAGILSATSGPDGGYRLARAAQSISLLAIVETADGTLSLEIDPAEQGANGVIERQLRQVCSTAAAQMRKHLSKVNLVTLTEDKEPAKKARPSSFKRPKKLPSPPNGERMIRLSKQEILDEAKQQLPFDKLVGQMMREGAL